jgi:DNA polymerase
MEITSPETSSSLLDQITNLISERYKNYKKESENSKIVYDIVNAGPRNRFTIKTKSGHLIVHNSGYGGWIGAWMAFKADEFLDEKKIKDSILAWREASPRIVALWKGLEDAAKWSVANPGNETGYNGIKYLCQRNVLYCTLPSGRLITYHRPLLTPSTRWNVDLDLSYEGWNTNPKNGRPGWIRMETYGGKLTENVVQAVARDILAHAIVNLERAGYPVVLHIHDEIVCEVPEGYGSVEEMERIMNTVPEWAKDWPVIAKEGWRAKRYAK